MGMSTSWAEAVVATPHARTSAARMTAERSEKSGTVWEDDTLMRALRDESIRFVYVTEEAEGDAGTDG
jgi:hypothetical protein